MEMKRRDFLMTASMATLASALGEDIKRKEPLRVAGHTQPPFLL